MASISEIAAQRLANLQAGGGIPYTDDPGQDPGFLQQQSDIVGSFWSGVSDTVAQKYQQAKIALQAVVGQFLQNPAKLQDMQNRVNYLADKADQTGDAGLRATANSFTGQIQDAQNNQDALSDKVMVVMKKIGAIDQAQANTPGELGQDPVITPLVILGVVGLAAGATALVVIQNKKVSYLNRLLSDVENKTLTPEEAAMLGKGAQMFGDLLGSPTTWIVGGLAIVGLWIWFRRR